MAAPGGDYLKPSRARGRMAVRVKVTTTRQGLILKPDIEPAQAGRVAANHGNEKGPARQCDARRFAPDISNAWVSMVVW
jgi:hypothetical protein